MDELIELVSQAMAKLDVMIQLLSEQTRAATQDQTLQQSVTEATAGRTESTGRSGGGTNNASGGVISAIESGSLNASNLLANAIENPFLSNAEVSTEVQAATAQLGGSLLGSLATAATKSPAVGKAVGAIAGSGLSALTDVQKSKYIASGTAQSVSDVAANLATFGVPDKAFLKQVAREQRAIFERRAEARITAREAVDEEFGTTNIKNTLTSAFSNSGKAAAGKVSGLLQQIADHTRPLLNLIRGSAKRTIDELGGG